MLSKPNAPPNWTAQLEAVRLEIDCQESRDGKRGKRKGIQTEEAAPHLRCQSLLQSLPSKKHLLSANYVLGAILSIGDTGPVFALVFMFLPDVARAWVDCKHVD